MTQGKIFNWADVDPWPFKYPWLVEKVVNGKNMQLIRAEFQPGATYRLHSHEREQFSFMLSGRMRLTVGDEVREIGPETYGMPRATCSTAAKSSVTSPWYS